MHTTVLLSVWALAAVVHGVWLGHSEKPGWEHAVGLGVVVVTGLLTWLTRPRVGEGVLQWDGGNWWWESGAVRMQGTVVSCLDLQRVLLVAFDTPPGRRQWMWLSQSVAPARWMALRRAVHSSPTAAPGSAGIAETLP